MQKTQQKQLNGVAEWSGDDVSKNRLEHIVESHYKS